MYKQKNRMGLSPIANPRNRANRKIKFPLSAHHLQRYTSGPYARGVHLWNRIHEDVQKAKTICDFKTSYGNYILGPELLG